MSAALDVRPARVDVATLLPAQRTAAPAVAEPAPLPPQQTIPTLPLTVRGHLHRAGCTPGTCPTGRALW